MIVQTMTDPLPKLDYFRLVPLEPEEGSLVALSVGYLDRGITVIFGSSGLVVELTKVIGFTVQRFTGDRLDIDLARALG